MKLLEISIGFPIENHSVGMPLHLKGKVTLGTHKFHGFGFTSDFRYMGLAHSNIWEPPVLLDRIAISEIKIKYLYFKK